MVSLEKQIDYNDAKRDIPLEFTQSMMHSNDLDVLKKVQREIIPRELSSFGYQTADAVTGASNLSNKLTFYASDPRMYLDMLNSYFTADFRAIATTGGDVALPSFLEKGGIHACIKTLTIKVGGTILMRLDDYNKWYNINNLATHSAEYANYMLASSLDSAVDYENEVDFVKQITYTAGGAGSSYDHTGGASEQLLTLAGASLTTEAQVGDILKLTVSAAPLVQYCRIIRIINATTANVSGVYPADIADSTITDVCVVKRRFPSTRDRVVNAGVAERGAVVAANITLQKVQWRLPVGCLSFFKYFPLPYIQNIAPLEIEFEFVHPALAISLRDANSANAANKLGYLISKPRWVAMLVEPSNKVREMHDMLYEGNGLWFPYLNYRHFQNRLASGDTDNTFTFQTNVSSARHIFSVLTSQANDDSATVATQAVQSQSTFFRSSINYFRFQSGSLQFPDYGNCQVSNFMAAEAWSQLLLAFNIKENTVHKSQIAPWEWQSTTSDKFIIATPLAKDETLWTGVALKNNFLEMILNKSTVATAYNCHSYLGYDCALVISKSSGCNVFD
jgi:hypothetical protein